MEKQKARVANIILKKKNSWRIDTTGFPDFL